MGNFGPCVVEDFVPYSDTNALISAGPSLDRLRYIADVKYKFGDEGMDLRLVNQLVIGNYVRLGHLWEGKPLWSEGNTGPHQPHRSDKDHYYYADGAPNAKIYCNGKLLIDHPPGVNQIGKPWVHGDHIYFEGHDSDKPAPTAWNIYRALKDGTAVEKLCEGANPAVYNSILYVSIWITQQFWIVRRALTALVFFVPQTLCA